MTSHETAIAARLRDAADRIPVETSVPSVTEVGRPRPRRRRVLLAATAAAVASAAAVIAVVGTRSTPESVKADAAGTEEAGCPPQPSAPEGCSPALAPHVADPPSWFGAPQYGFRSSGFRRGGRWVSMAIGRESSTAITQPIVVSVFDGDYLPLAEATPVTIGGVPLRSSETAGWRILATNGTPTVAAMGNVDEDTLAAVLAAVEVGDVAGELSLRLPRPPEGYREIVGPRPLGEDHDHRRSLGSASADTGINEASDWTDPLLAAAASGADLEPIDLDGATGWIGRTTGNPAGPLRFLVWSPAPGVVFEISTLDMELTDQDLADLARATSPIDPAEWDVFDTD